ncbi:MAG: hypothetical protein ACR2LE_03075 [Nocardioidaceae bacterium]
MATVEENVRDDLVARGLNDDVRVQVLNSRDNPDVWGQPNVSRVIVGGTIGESGLFTIGISQSIDPGNFEHEDSALVLLDLLSGATDTHFADASLNSYITSKSQKVNFIGRALGNVISHEAGHFMGSWHVDQFNPRANLMDQASNFSRMFGVGPDGVGGTDDDRDVDFGEDTLNPYEGFAGLEDTLTTRPGHCVLVCNDDWALLGLQPVLAQRPWFLTASMAAAAASGSKYCPPAVSARIPASSS